MLAPGTLVDRYELVSPIGEGGMAQVWVARQKGKHGFEKLFAFKCIHTRFADHPAFRRMFLDEARIAASIEHPNVAQVFDLGESDSMLYLVMEFVDGESLGSLMTAAARRVNESVPVPTGVALRIIADALAGVHAAHSLEDADGNLRGVVHRDVSPQNILVSVRGDVKVIDFGIAVAKDRIGGDTAEGSLKGKLHYMAPEQALREPIGPYTDVYAMGCTLYRMLAGFPPHDGGNDAATLHLLLSGAEPPALPDSVPPLVAAIIEHALERDPSDRYSSAAAMQTAIEAAIMEEGYVTDVATWVNATLSDNTRERRAQLATRSLNIVASPAAPAAAPSFLAELGPLPAIPRAPAPAPAPAPDLALAPAPAPAPAPARLNAVPIGLPLDGPISSPPPSHNAHSSSSPGMLDVRALVASRAAGHAAAHAAPRRGEANSESGPPPSSSTSRSRDRGSAPPGVNNVAEARDAPQRIGPATKSAVDNAGARAGGWIKLAILAIVLVLGLAAVMLFLPMIVRDRVVASAREAGIDLTVDRVGIGLGGVSLRDVTAKIQRVPGVEMRADEIFATGFSAREVRVRGLDLKAEGHVREVGPALLAFYNDNRGRLAGGTETRKVSIASAHIGWNGFLGEGTRLDAGEVGTELESRSVGAEDIRTIVGRFEIKTKRTTFGPWASTFERNPATSRLRLLFDPPVPDGPSMLIFWGNAASPHLTVKIPRSPFARLGIRPEDLGLPADPATEIEVKAEAGQSPNGRVELAGHIDVVGVWLKSLKSPMNLKLEASASGLPGKPLDLEKTSVVLGPFVVAVTGAITPTDGGFRLDAAWRTLPIPCEKLARAEAKSMGPIAVAIQDLARTTGAARVTGTAQASGIVKYDTKTPDEGTATSVTREACGLSIFGL